MINEKAQNLRCSFSPYLFMMRSIKNLTSPQYEDSQSFPSSIFIHGNTSSKDSDLSLNNFNSVTNNENYNLIHGDGDHYKTPIKNNFNRKPYYSFVNSNEKFKPDKINNQKNLNKNNFNGYFS